MPLSADDLKRLRVLVTPAAWAAHEVLDAAGKVDLELAFEVYGDVRLVAADVLEAVCLKARGAALTAPGKKRLKVGKIEIEKAATGSASSANADAWCALAARLRDQAAGSGVPGPSLVGWDDGEVWP
ncbi:hypothetical protein GCM10017784_30290 [Deinococcus indicus]|uniref:hypothetical protein n=1 Tax=Deinococcus indicus TaxID=223556 RepID=UPI00174C2200|nr:hypothetical protein [Deinococcus indicus]GHG34434.1 hypothetical protein GCM10017784_30290 [Deinococcus indicus]